MPRREGRGKRYARFRAKVVNQLSDPEFHKAVVLPSYMETIKQVMSVPYVKRKKGEPNPSGNVSELSDIPFDEFHIKYHEHYGLFLREGGHFQYNADTANRIRRTFLENL